LAVDYYYLLGLQKEATPKDIKSAYRRMAEIYHPDKLQALPENVRREGEEIMRLLNEAKSVLLDPARREEYDRIPSEAYRRREDAIIIPDTAEEEEFEIYLAIEKENLASKMKNVLSTMKVVFNKDDDFQTKIAIAQESVEARVLEDEAAYNVDVIEEEGRGPEENMEEMGIKNAAKVVTDRKDAEDGGREDEASEVEMTLEFSVVAKGPGNDTSTPSDPKKKKPFRIVAIEGDDQEGGGAVDVDWEEEKGQEG